MGRLFRGSEATVNSLYSACQLPRQSILFAVAVFPHVANITTTRRLNTVAIYQDYLRERIGAGEAPKGLDQAFAASLEISPSMWSQIKSSRPIGDKLARQVEQHAGKPSGWLDQAHDGLQLVDPAEEKFIAVAKTSWRAANAGQKRALLKLLQLRG